MKKFKNFSTTRKICFIVFSLLTLFILWFVFSHSAKTAEMSSKDSASISQTVADIVNLIFNTSLTSDNTVGFVRICAHIAEFAALSFCFSASFECVVSKEKASFPISVSFAATIATIDEIIQIFFDGRAFQFSDILCDTLGGTIGVLFFSLCLKLVLKIRKRKKL